jgi:hypothetical protein
MHSPWLENISDGNNHLCANEKVPDVMLSIYARVQDDSELALTKGICLLF